MRTAGELHHASVLLQIGASAFKTQVVAAGVSTMFTPGFVLFVDSPPLVLHSVTHCLINSHDVVADATIRVHVYNTAPDRQELFGTGDSDIRSLLNTLDLGLHWIRLTHNGATVGQVALHFTLNGLVSTSSFLYNAVLITIMLEYRKQAYNHCSSSRKAAYSAQPYSYYLWGLATAARPSP